MRKSAAQPPVKPLKKKAGLTSSRKRAAKHAEVRPEPLIVGFDCEWVKEGEGNRVLSYQVACRYGVTEWTWIYYTRSAARIRYPEASEQWIAENFRDRCKFANVIAAAIGLGIRRGFLRAWPKSVVACAHWTRADLSAMEDFDAIKRSFDGVQKTYTVVKPYFARARLNGHSRCFTIVLVDTRLLAPGTSKSLAALGQLYNFRKLDVGDYIEKMDRLLADNPTRYEEYAIRDAEISARHVAEIMRFVADDLGLSTHKAPITLGSIAVQYLLKSWADHGVDVDAVNGITNLQTKTFNSSNNRYVTRRKKQQSEGFRLNEELANASFHGGRNECFFYGPTPEGEYREYDLHSAYTTALAAIEIPDYSAAYTSIDPAEFTADIMGYARVRFRFPRRTSYPSLPVVASGARGLVFPMTGEAFITAPEIATARHLGAEIQIMHALSCRGPRGAFTPSRL